MKTYQPHLSSVGDARANIIAVLCYIALISLWNFSILLILPIFFCEKKSGFVRFHSIQAALLWVLKMLFGGGLTFEATAALLTGDAMYMNDPYGWGGPVTVVALRLMLGFVVMLLAGYAGYCAVHWQEWKIPILGQMASGICKASRAAMYNGEEHVPQECLVDAEDEQEHVHDDISSKYALVPIGIQQAIEKPAVATERFMLVQGASASSLSNSEQVAPTNAMLPAVVGVRMDENAEHLTAEELQGVELVSAKDERAQQQAMLKGKKRKANEEALSLDDPNRHIPADMRDVPSGENELQRKSARKSRKKKKRLTSTALQNNDNSSKIKQTKPANQEAVPITVSYSERVWMQDKKANMTEKVMENVLQLDAPEPQLPQPLQIPKASDPNSQLPPDMRDTPTAKEKKKRTRSFEME